MKYRLLLVLISVLIFSACSAQKTTSIDSSELISTDSQNDQTNAASTVTPNPNPKLNKNSQQKDPVMKTLADFTPIVASAVTIKTTQGDLVISLYRDKAPLTTLNFLTLVKDGFYDEVVFHRVIKDFMAQVGDPLSKDETQQSLWGTGGPGYAIPDEFDSTLKHDRVGVVSMANSGSNTGGSQFFITYVATPWLDGKHAIFGQVTTGLDVLQKINVGDKIIAISYQ